jgi:hypothetical protein
MKIAVIGKGTASIITTLVLLQNGHEVEIYYDPNTKPLVVGESTTPHIAFLIHEVLGIDVNDMVEYDIASIKVGVKFINWGKSKEFTHNFKNQLAFHLENTDFNPFIHNILESNNLVKYVPQRVTHTEFKNGQCYIGENSYDFVIFCTGWQNDDSYFKPIFQTVNSAILYIKNSVNSHNLHTIHKATEDGWEFGLPFPKKNITKCGYLFDKTKIKVDDVCKKLSSNKHFEWTPRYSKHLLQNHHTAFNGNRLFFIEPLQALSFYYVKEFTQKICEYLNNPTEETFHKVNYDYLQEMWVYQLSLAYHYSHGSSYHSQFWDEIVHKAQNFMSHINNGNEEIFLNNLIVDLKSKGKTNYCKIGSFSSEDFKQLHCGMTRTTLSDVIKKFY